MKKIKLFILLLLSAQFIHGQTYFNLDELIYYANCETLNKFDKKIRKKGFSFEKSSTDKKGAKSYTYKQTEEVYDKDLNMTIIATNKVTYKDFADGKPSILISIGGKKTFDIIRNEIDKEGSGYDCEIETPKSSMLRFICRSSNYYIKIDEEKKKMESGNVDYSLYDYIIYKK